MTETNVAEITENDALEMEDISDFIIEHEITMHVLLAHENPYRRKETQQVHWSCKIINERSQYIIVYFSKGVAIRRWSKPPDTGLGDTLPIHVPHDKVDTPYDGPMPPFENEEDRRTFNFCSKVEPPFLVEVLDVLAKDVCLLEQTGAFDLWAQALKVSSDSRTARGAFDIVCQQRIELLTLLGEEPYHKLLYEIERLKPDEATEENN